MSDLSDLEEDSMQNRVALYGALAVVLAAGAIAWLMLDRPMGPTEPAVGQPVAGLPAEAEPGAELGAPVKATPPGGPVSAAASPAGPKAARPAFPQPKNRVDPAARETMLRDLRTRVAHRGEPAAEGAGDARVGKDDEPRGSLSKEYIQQSMREIIPLVKECYELALAEEPELSGKLTVRFEVVADEEQGGLVADSQIMPDEARPTPNALLAECLQETMYALKLQAPKGGGKVVVTYPFIFNAER
jgi:hypothetical protein